MKIKSDYIIDKLTLMFYLTADLEPYLYKLFGANTFSDNIPIQDLLNETGLSILYDSKYIEFFISKLSDNKLNFDKVTELSIIKKENNHDYINLYRIDESALIIKVLFNKIIIFNNINNNANLIKIINDALWVKSATVKLANNLRNIYEERIKKIILLTMNFKKIEQKGIILNDFSDEFKKEYKEQLAKLKLLIEDN